MAAKDMGSASVARQSEAREWLALKLAGGHCSDLLVAQIDDLIEGRVTNVWAIYDEIAGLEKHPNAKPTRTKRAEVFKGELLCGLWHKHYNRSSMVSMVRNLDAYWGRNNRFARMFEKEIAGKVSTQDDYAKLLSYRLVMDGLVYNRDVTGEWIVFAKQSGLNYYLTLATHEESNELIWERCKRCSVQFPNLHILKEKRNAEM